MASVSDPSDAGIAYSSLAELYPSLSPAMVLEKAPAAFQAALSLKPRYLEDLLNHLLATFPVVVVTGARQTGKSTLVRLHAAAHDRTYLTLDAVEIREQAQRRPRALLERGETLTIDEVQRVPDLLLAVKEAVDEDRQPGRFLLTGSANLLLMRQVSESLAGRAVYLTLWPMTRREQMGLGTAGAWSTFFDSDSSAWLDALRSTDAPADRWQNLAQRGGYPVPALHLDDSEKRRWWFDGYTRTYLERDLQDLSNISSLADFRRLMRAAALRTGNLLNQAEVARDVVLAPTTAQRYLNLLEVSYQLVPLPAYAVNRTKRLIKSPKAYWSDPGLALFLTGESPPGGAYLENLALLDLLAWSEMQPGRPGIFYWRTAKGAEVDLVVEKDGRLLPIEIKASRTARQDDIRHLRTFRSEYPESLPALLLYDGEEAFWIADDVIAAPWWMVF
jgi:uncharacterized protein